MKKILLVTKDLPATNRKGWSGIPFSLMKQLEKQFQVDCHCIKKDNCLFAIVKTIYYRKVKKSFVSINMLKRFAKKYAGRLERIVEDGGYDAIVSTDFSSAGSFAYCKTSKPIIYFSDCVAAGMVDYYWFNVHKNIQKEMNEVQKQALDKATAVVLTSHWAKRDAIRFYQTQEGKIHILPMGANTELTDFVLEDHENINLLFVGVDWVRKGADIAIECVKWLNEHSVEKKYYLHLIGCNPPTPIDCEYVKLYGFLDRNISEQRELLENVRAKTDFFLLPTKAECAGIVFCEACAYSLPSITFDTGGIEDYIINGYNGYRLPMGSTGEDFGKVIKKLAEEPELLQRMKQNARKRYDEELNWTATGAKLCDIISELIGK